MCVTASKRLVWHLGVKRQYRPVAAAYIGVVRRILVNQTAPILSNGEVIVVGVLVLVGVSAAMYVFTNLNHAEIGESLPMKECLEKGKQHSMHRLPHISTILRQTAPLGYVNSTSKHFAFQFA